MTVISDQEIVYHTVAVYESHAECMACGENYLEGASCSRCKTALRNAALAYPGKITDLDAFDELTPVGYVSGPRQLISHIS